MSGPPNLLQELSSNAFTINDGTYFNPAVSTNPTFPTAIPSQLQSQSISITNINDNFESDANSKAIHKYHIKAWRHLKTYNYNDSLGIGDIVFSFIERRERLKNDRDKLNVLNLPSFIHLMRVGAEDVFKTFDSLSTTSDLRICNTETCRSRYVPDSLFNMDIDYKVHQHEFNEVIRTKYTKEQESILAFIDKVSKDHNHPGCETAKAIIEKGFDSKIDDNDKSAKVNSQFELVHSKLKGAELFLDPICAYSKFNFLGIATEIQKFSNVITTASTGCVAMIDILPPNIPILSRFGVGLIEDIIHTPSSSFVGSNNRHFQRWWVKPTLLVGDNLENPKMKMPPVNTAIWPANDPSTISIVQDKSLPVPYWDIGCVHRLIAGSKSFPDDRLMGNNEPYRSITEIADKIGSLGTVEIILRRGLFQSTILNWN